MLQQMRNNAQNFKWILWAVIFSFIVSFVIIFQGGMGGFQTTGATHAAKVAGRPISDSAFRDALIRQEDYLRQILGAQYDAGRFLNPRAVLDSLVDREILLVEADRAGVDVSPKEVARTIREVPAFQGTDGRFDRELYTAYLKQRGLRADGFERQLADDLRVSTMSRLLAAGAVLPTAAVKSAWQRDNETVDLEYVVFPFEKHLTAVQASEDELRAYHEANQDEMDGGPGRQIRAIRVSREAFQKQAEREDEMRAYYDQNVGAIYTLTEDQRRASVILVAPAGSDAAAREAARAEADALASRARAGEDFAALARAESDDTITRERGGDMGPFYQGIQEPAVDTAVFAAAEGAIVGPIETIRGFEILLVTKGPGVKARTFEDVRDLVARGLYAKSAAEAQAAAVKKFQEAFAAKPDFAAAAATAGLTVSEPVWITAETRDIPGVGPNPTVVAQAFSLDVKSVSEPIADVGGQILIEVLAARESSPKSFEDARAEMEAAIKERKARELARAEAETFRAAAVTAADLASVAGAPAVRVALQVTRSRGIPELGRAPDLIAAAFDTPVGQVTRVASVPTGEAVARVTALTGFDEARFEAERDALAERLQEQQASALRSAALERLREAYKGRIKINEALLAAYSPAPQGS